MRNLLFSKVRRKIYVHFLYAHEGRGCERSGNCRYPCMPLPKIAISIGYCQFCVDDEIIEFLVNFLCVCGRMELSWRKRQWMACLT